MTDKKKLIRFFTGSIIDVHALKDMLEEKGIPSMIKDDFRTGINAGIPIGMPSAIDLYIYDSDMETAKKVLDNFKE